MTSYRRKDIANNPLFHSQHIVTKTSRMVAYVCQYF